MDASTSDHKTTREPSASRTTEDVRRAVEAAVSDSKGFRIMTSEEFLAVLRAVKSS